MIVCKTGLCGQILQIQLRAPLTAEGDVSVVVMDYDGDTLSDDTASAPSASWTTTAAAGRGQSDPRILTYVLGSEAGDAAPAPGWYFLSASDGSFEKVRVISSTSTRIVCGAPIKLAYPIGSVLTPAVINYVIPDEVVVEETQITVNVSYVQNDGRLTAYNEEGYVSDAPAGNPVTVDYMLQAYPQLQGMEQILGAADEFQVKLDHVWDSVRSRLISSGLVPEQFRAVAALQQVVCYEFLLQLSLGGADPTGKGDPNAYAERIDAILERKWNELFVTKQFIDQEQTKKHDDMQRGLGRRIEW